MHPGEDLKADAESGHANLLLGLFSYPVLQAADILLYKQVYEASFDVIY
jgi:tryptophanyl-tRNA synthetase